MYQLVFKKDEYITHLIYRSQNANYEGYDIYDYIREHDYVIIDGKLVRAKEFFKK